MLGTLAGSAAVASAALPGAAAGSLLSGAIGLIASQFQDDFRRHLAGRVTDPRAALQNHDLNQLVAETIQLVLRELGQDKAHWKKALEALGRTAREQWPRVCQYPGIARLERDELEGVLEEDLTDLLADSPGDPSKTRALDVDIWRTFLDFVADRTAGVDGLSEPVLTGAAERLAHRFAWAFRELAKKDFENGGKAFAGLHLMTQGELLAGVRAIAEDVEAIRAELPQLEVRMATSTANLLGTMDERARRRHRAVLGTLDRVATWQRSRC